MTKLTLRQAAELFGGRNSASPMHPRTIARLLHGDAAPFCPAHDDKILLEDLAAAIDCDKNLLLRVVHGQDSFHNQIDAALMLDLSDRAFKRYRSKGFIQPTVKARGIVRYSRRYLNTLLANHPW